MSGKQIELFSIANPCVGVCQSNSRGYCVGCFRSREERFNWHLKTPQEQRRIIQLLAQRKSRLMQQLNAKHASDNVQNAPAPTQTSLFEFSAPDDENMDESPTSPCPHKTNLSENNNRGPK